MSNALIEAMLCGLAIVASDMPQVTRTFPNEEGLFFQQKILQCLQYTWKKLIDSETYCSALGASIATFSKEYYSSDRVAKEYSAS